MCAGHLRSYRSRASSTRNYKHLLAFGRVYAFGRRIFMRRKQPTGPRKQALCHANKKMGSGECTGRERGKSFTLNGARCSLAERGEKKEKKEERQGHWEKEKRERGERKSDSVKGTWNTLLSSLIHFSLADSSIFRPTVFSFSPVGLHLCQSRLMRTLWWTLS